VFRVPENDPRTILRRLGFFHYGGGFGDRINWTTSLIRTPDEGVTMTDATPKSEAELRMDGLQHKYVEARGSWGNYARNSGLEQNANSKVVDRYELKVFGRDTFVSYEWSSASNDGYITYGRTKNRGKLTEQDEIFSVTKIDRSGNLFNSNGISTTTVEEARIVHAMRLLEMERAYLPDIEKPKKAAT